MKRRLLLAAPALIAAPAFAQPTQIRIICPFAPGGAGDTLARFAAQAITEATGTPVLVENRTGAGGNLGGEFVARAAPDGATLLMMAAAQASNATLYRNLSFNVLRDFTPVCVVGVVPNLLSVHPSVPAQDMAEFLAFARAQRGGITYGSAGIGTIPHLAMVMLAQRGGFEATHVPFRGTVPALTELLAGRIQSVLENLPPQAGHVRAGAIRPIAVSTAERLPDWPGLATIGESFAGFEAVAWQSLVAPAGTPMGFVRRIAEVVLGATSAQAARLRGMGFVPGSIGPDVFPAFLQAEVAKWAEAVRLSGATAE
ncbi:tripartite tricarboxylate transporter substrate-binding protein [Sediminicoccus sp. KRV36]|uniref:tripartite tricarboxylate transporter substrate-binding protein n=1 Tax=Sediminicoccus sp. KRV36 TaxID=3133721 RepID=UPI00200C5BE1|nr:tripartite tricarboxylate transporter substrate-binding protein [Sediminicoccus rosea]UPY38250.1 tripartite tricarboxylate transporter substrate binding protein [Sediminicoccus rosea]